MEILLSEMLLGLRILELNGFRCRRFCCYPLICFLFCLSYGRLNCFLSDISSRFFHTDTACLGYRFFLQIQHLDFFFFIFFRTLSLFLLDIFQSIYAGFWDETAIVLFYILYAFVHSK